MTPANPPDRPPVNEPPVSATRSDGPVNGRARELLGKARDLLAEVRGWELKDAFRYRAVAAKISAFLAEPAETVRVTDRVTKSGGDYYFAGTIQADFVKRSGARRIVVENDDGILHIFNPSQVQPAAPAETVKVTEGQMRAIEALVHALKVCDKWLPPASDKLQWSGTHYVRSEISRALSIVALAAASTPTRTEPNHD